MHAGDCGEDEVDWPPSTVWPRITLCTANLAMAETCGSAAPTSNAKATGCGTMDAPLEGEPSSCVALIFNWRFQFVRRKCRDFAHVIANTEI